jgi:signal transduction histidine kinase
MFYAKIRSLIQTLSIRWRLTLLFVAVFGTSFIAFAIFIFNFLASTLQHEFDDALFNYAVDVHESITLDPGGDLSLQTPALDRNKQYPFAFGTALIQIRHASGEVLTQVGNFGSLVLSVQKDLARIKAGEEASFRTISRLEGLPNKEAEEYRVVTLPIDNSPTPQLLLQVAVPMTLLEEQISNRRLILLFTFPLALLVSILAGYYLSLRAMKPVTEMVESAGAIGAEQLDLRVPVPVANDEIHNLAIAINGMLGRIEKAFSSQERFIADASHQLLTPLAIMQGEIEAALRSPEPASASVLKSNLQEVAHLSQIVQQLLLLARVESGRGALKFSQVSFADIVGESVTRAAKSAEKKNIRLKFNISAEREDLAEPVAWGDFDLLQNLVFNLIENAIKYSPEGQTVQIHLQWLADKQLLYIEDQGPGIPTDQLDLIFERFHRAQTQESGHGLGLAIAKKIADAHSIRLWVENKYLNSLDKTNPTGCLFGLEIKNF